MTSPKMTFCWLQIFNGNTDRNTIVTNNINPAIPSARFVRIRPQEYHEYISLRFEILGCKSGNGYLQFCSIIAIINYIFSNEYFNSTNDYHKIYS